MITRNPLQQMSSLPAAEATVAAPLTRHLAGELYGVELRLADGLRVAGKPCDCLDNGRNLNLEATARKLTSLDPNNRVYRESWTGFSGIAPYCRLSPSAPGSMTMSTRRWPARSQTSASALWVPHPLPS